jgi:protein-tyrosine phosphatase
MFTEPYWIKGPWPGRLAISARPRGGDWLEDEMKAWRRIGIHAVVSLLTPDEMEEMNLQDEAKICREIGVRFYSLPIVDRGVPALDKKTIKLIESVDADLARGENTAVHCRQGIGRSGLVAASLLVVRGLLPATAVQLVGSARHAPIPETPEQRAWIDAFAATLSPAGHLPTDQ